MSIKIFDSSGEELSLTDGISSQIFNKFNGPLDPRVSSCVHCNNAVVAYDPFEKLIDAISSATNDDEMISKIYNFLENAASVHLYIWEENTCIHNLWLDPLFAEWSNATGEKRIRH